MTITIFIVDDKPVVVVTHGDRLSIQQRVHVQAELAELLDIPVQQIYDILGMAPVPFLSWYNMEHFECSI